MKSTLFFSAICSIGCAFASGLPPNDIRARYIDPNTLDPTKLSVLKVLKTAMPTDPNAPMPTGGLQPDWYVALPADVKSILPELYPATTTAPPTPSSSSAAAVAAEVSSSAVAKSEASSTVTLVSVTGTSYTTVTKTMQYASTGYPVPSANGTLSNATLSRPSSVPTASPSGFFSAGARSADVVRVEMLAAAGWMVLGAGFLLFA